MSLDNPDLDEMTALFDRLCVEFGRVREDVFHNTRNYIQIVINRYPTLSRPERDRMDETTRKYSKYLRAMLRCEEHRKQLGEYADLSMRWFASTDAAYMTPREAQLVCSITETDAALLNKPTPPMSAIYTPNVGPRMFSLYRYRPSEAEKKAK